MGNNMNKGYRSLWNDSEPEGIKNVVFVLHYYYFINVLYM